MKHMSFTCNITVVVLMLLSAAAISAQQGEYITLEAENIKSFRVYAAGPVDVHRGILMIHGWLGLNQGNEALTTKYASAGYLAMTIGHQRWRCGEKESKSSALLGLTHSGFL